MAKLIDITGKVISGEWGVEDSDGNGIPVLRTANFTNDGNIDYKNVVTRNIQKKNINEKFLRYGDIIIEKSGGSDKQPVGRVVFFDGDENKYLFNNFTGLLRIKDREKWLSKYVFYRLFANYLNGGTRPYENRTTGLHNLQTDSYVASIEIPDISIKEQGKIVKVMDALQLIIAKQQQQLTDLDDLVKSRFIEMFGDPVENPMGWVRKTLQQLVTVEPQNGLYKPQSDYVQDKSGIPILRIDAFYDGKVTDLTNLKRLICSDAEKERYLLKENDIVINRVNSIEYLGKCAHITGMCEDTVFESNMMRFHLDEEQTDAVFITHLLCSKYVYNQILRTAKKAVNQASINQKDVLSFEVYVPPLELQNQFAAFVAQADKSKLAAQKGLQELEVLKKSLMQQYFG